MQSNRGEKSREPVEELRRARARARRADIALASIGIGLLVLAALPAVAQLWSPSVAHSIELGAGLAVMLAAGVGAVLAARRFAQRSRDLDVALVLTTEDGSSYRRQSPSSPEGSARPEATGRSGKGSRCANLGAQAMVFVSIAILVVVFISLVDSSAPTSRRWTFTDRGVSTSDMDLDTSTPEAGEWLMEEHQHATGAAALVNRAGDPGARPATALVRESRTRDALVTTRCKVEKSGACGLVFRYQDAHNHYVARIDAGQQKIALAVVQADKERLLASVDATIAPGAWHELATRIEADRVVVYFNGREVIGTRDTTFRGHGSVGLWAPSHCIAYFDEFALRPVSGGGDELDFLPFVMVDRPNKG